MFLDLYKFNEIIVLTPSYLYFVQHSHTQFHVKLIISKLLKYVMKERTIRANTAWAEC